MRLITHSGKESKWEGTNAKGKLKSITKSTKTRKYLNSCTRVKILNFKVKWKVGRSWILLSLFQWHLLHYSLVLVAFPVVLVAFFLWKKSYRGNGMIFSGM